MTLFDEFFYRFRRRHAEYMGVEEWELPSREPYPEDYQRFQEIYDYIKSKGLPEKAILHYVDYYYGLIKKGTSFSTLGMAYSKEGAVPHYVHFCPWYKANYYRIKDDDDAVFKICWDIRFNEQRLEGITKRRDLLGVKRLGSGDTELGTGRTEKGRDEMGYSEEEYLGVRI